MSAKNKRMRWWLRTLGSVLTRLADAMPLQNRVLCQSICILSSKLLEISATIKNEYCEYCQNR